MEFVEDGDCIFIDNSTTCYYFAEALSESNYRNIVLVTNSGIIPELFINNEFINIKESQVFPATIAGTLHATSLLFQLFLKLYKIKASSV